MIAGTSTVCVALSACGGGGGGTPAAPAAPSTTPTVPAPVVPVTVAPVTPPAGVTSTNAIGATLTRYNLSPLRAMPGATDWSTFRGNAAHSGFVPVNVNPSNFSARWKYEMPVPAGVLTYMLAPTNSGGRLYFAGVESYLVPGSCNCVYSLSEADAELVWKRDFGKGASNTPQAPATANGKVYTATGGATTAMFTLDASTGALLTTSPAPSQGVGPVAATPFGGSVYLNAGPHGGFYQFDGSTGAQKSFTPVDMLWGTAAAVDANYAYVYRHTYLVVFDRVSGEPVAKIDDPTAQVFTTSAGAPVLGSAGTVFVRVNSAAYNEGISAIDVPSRKVRWTVPGSFAGAAYNNGVLYALNYLKSRIEAYAETDGKLLWSMPAPENSADLGDLIITNKFAFVGSEKGVFAIDLDKRQVVWSTPARGSLSVSANGILYVQGGMIINAFNLQ
ncbi:outer membrane protein assembly factor BamB family protein [Massilia aquatica]|uniref:PQQ-binding-like beta-propeller repeat protein n=1 Tax=Massilia aquatica TaxID=2609000 RepID=A0ABX0M553_9BURK|nr:PQQ-binding-like beta-propeller repeat protein [Massilia aquatica]NHZ40195.1 PQQ-binding-like beta-propeller repeat protein [Massilia aquatica]